MSVCRLIFLVTGILSVHGGLSDVTDHVTPDIRNVLLVVSGLTHQIEELKKVQLKDHQKILSLEEKYKDISGENYRLRNMIGILENLHRNGIHQTYTSPEDILRKGSAPDNLRERKLVMKGIPSGRNITAHTDIHQTATQTVEGQNYPESTTEYETRPRNHRHRRGVKKSTERHIRSEQPKRGVSIRVEKYTDVVAFSAYLSHHIVDPGDEYSMIYGGVITNVGNAYNPTTGVFTCPKAGTYVFTWNIGMVHTGYIYTSLVKNGRDVAYSYLGEDHYRSTSSQTSVLELNLGDIISVRIGSHSTSPMLWASYTSFNGFILE